ncbi:hypothetical protein R3P38DRAFT_3026765 [Favolaschia claudopus]|uniref:Zn(2)-C6 fungal-type domain-containing protein n=1 Tax=Favolaschia claudopus TaxID=2862362 RepID=A0AAW0AFR0_9AGAR
MTTEDENRSTRVRETMSRHALRRNQACRSCRKKKLKCDAQRPHCGNCLKQYQVLTSVPAPVGYAHPAEPQCSYDLVDGFALAPDTDPAQKIKQLETQIALLKNKLHERKPSSPASVPLAPADDSDNETVSPSHTSPSSGSQSSTDPAMELLFSGWNMDLPEPTRLNHYIDTFFKYDPCGARIFHRPALLASLQLSCTDPGFPHSAILHAICATASRWAPHNVSTLPDGTKRDLFAEFHATKTRYYLDKTMATGEEIFPIIQACILLCWYFFNEGRWVEVWIFAGFLTRVGIPLRLNYPGTFATHGHVDHTPVSYLAPPGDFQELESRRRAWWMAIVFDRLASLGGWVHAVDERDLGTELPVRHTDFESNFNIPSNPQDLATPNVFITHLPQYTDSFILFIKAVMLFGRVTDYNVRGGLRSTTTPRKGRNPFSLPGFKELDKLVCYDFLESLPLGWKNHNGVVDTPDGFQLDSDLYMVQIIPHAATIILHNPFLDFVDPHCASTPRCVNSARTILDAYHTYFATGLDAARLHPFAVICWYLAGVVLVQHCKHLIVMGEEQKRLAVWADLNTLRDAMLAYGERSAIGTRQENLLRALMREVEDPERPLTPTEGPVQ